MSMVLNYYDILEVKKCATLSEITQKYRKLALELHPDKHDESLPPELRQAYLERFKQINIAYTVLRCEEARKKYDFHLVFDTRDHSYFDYCYEPDKSSNKKRRSKINLGITHTIKEDHEEEYYYLLLMASKYDKNLLSAVAVDTDPTGPQIRAMKRYVMDLENYRNDTKRRIQEIYDGFKNLAKQRKKKRDTSEDNTSGNTHSFLNC